MPFTTTEKATELGQTVPYSPFETPFSSLFPLVGKYIATYKHPNPLF